MNLNPPIHCNCHNSPPLPWQGWSALNSAGQCWHLILLPDWLCLVCAVAALLLLLLLLLINDDPPSDNIQPHNNDVLRYHDHS